MLWAGTAAGLARQTDDRFEAPRQVPATLREQILGIAEDKLGSLWIATSNHVLRVSREKVIGGDVAAGDVREFGVGDGLRGTEGVKRHRSVVTDALWRIWFSLNQGISVVDPPRLTRSSDSALAHIQLISIDGQQMEPRGRLRIPSGRHRIVFGYVGLSLSLPERVRFRYKLDGSDDEWSAPAAEREASYTNLGPGAFRFRIIASSPDGVWNPREDEIAFEVDPAFWQTWWFRSAVLLGSVLAMVAVCRLRVHQMAAQLNVRLRSVWAKEPESRRNCMTPCCRAFSAPPCSWMFL